MKTNTLGWRMGLLGMISAVLSGCGMSDQDRASFYANKAIIELSEKNMIPVQSVKSEQLMRAELEKVFLEAINDKP